MDKNTNIDIYRDFFFTNIYFDWCKGDLAGALTTQLRLFGIKVLGQESCVTYWAHIFKAYLRINILSPADEIAYGWIPAQPIVEKSTLIQGMAWCRQTTSHYLIQCWPRPKSP